MNGPWRITFDTNPDDCNLRCVMCEEFSTYSNLKQLRVSKGNTPKRRRMDISVIESVLQEVTENYDNLVEIIPSTMGEPLLYKNFNDIIKMCKRFNVKLNLTTNGTFPRMSAKEWAEILVPVLSDVKISWNGFTKETQEKVMVNSNYDKRLDSLKQFIAYRDEYAKTGDYASVTLQLTFMEMNYREFPDLVKMAIDLGVDRVKGHHLWAHFDEIKEQSMRRNTDAIRRWNETVQEVYRVVEANPRQDGSKIRLDNFYELDDNAPERLLENSVCPFLGKEAWVAWDGRFNPCCAPDEDRKTLGYFGNLSSDGFTKIWEGEEYRYLVENYNDNPLCRSCNMRRES